LENWEDVLALLLAARQFGSRIEGFYWETILLQKEKWAHLVDDPITGELEIELEIDRYCYRHCVKVHILLYVRTLIYPVTF